MNCIINILTKNPESNRCKTRMKKLLTKDERVFLSKEMLKMTCNEISEINIDKYLHVYPDTSGSFIKNLSSIYRIKLLHQSTGCLSQKIYIALDYQKDKYEKRIVIGSDIPSISTEEINDCLDYLDHYDLVIGPSNDDGFYLVGAKNQSHELLNNMNLNKIQTQDIINLCRTHTVKYKLLRVLKDIDTPSDLLNL